MSQPKQSGKKSKFSRPPSFCSIQATNGLEGACPHWEEQPALLSLRIQMPISPEAPSDIPRNNV